ncbi:MAG: phosphoadenylyl-sulfate reductase [Planctomycetota bacterium]
MSMSQLVGILPPGVENLTAADLVARVAERLGPRVALASSLSAEDQVLTDMLCRAVPGARVFTLDTGRLPQETYDTIAATNERYGIRIKMLFPGRHDVEELVAEAGPNLFYASVAARKRCCHVRKVVPLQRELATLDAWITGLRREQAVTRRGVQSAEWDEANGLMKLNPLANWTEEHVWAYIREHGVPYNALHDQGYRSIGCAPCTRPIGKDEDVRAGRWWWEEPAHKECGLHVGRGKLAKAAQEPA